jgi:hypothetical protein
MAEGKITLSTDPNWYGATVDNYQASGPVVNIPANQLVGFEPDDKMNQPKSKVNVEKIVAGLKQGAKLPPLLVRKYKNGYQVLDGHHRFWAYKLLSVKSIPAQIVPDSDIEEISKQGVAETRRGQIPMTLKPGETDNLEPEDFAGFKKLPAYQQGQAAQQKAGKQLIQKSPYTFQSDQDWAYRQGATDAQRAAMFANFGGTKPLTTAEGEQQPGADYRDPKEVDYDGEYDAMVARVKRLAGLGPMKTVYDPNKRVYRNMPTAVQPKK